jgi:hypothetical protein
MGELESLQTLRTRQVSFVARIVVGLNWVVVLILFFTHNVPRSVSQAAFMVFRFTAVLAVFWVIAEVAEGFAGRIRFGRIFVDGLLTLSMFAFWFLVVVGSY